MLQYAEGYALAEIGTTHLHAWCVDRAGRVVDPTWHGGPKSATGLAYLGKVFDLADVAKARRGPKKSVSIINDWRRGFPLFKEAKSSCDLFETLHGAKRRILSPARTS